MEIERGFLFPVPNLHTDWPVLEQWLRVASQEQSAFQRCAATRVDDFFDLYRRITGSSSGAPAWPAAPGIDLSAFVADLVLSLQRAVGHPVRLTRSLQPRDEAAVRFVVEYDDEATVLAASALACRLVERWLSGDTIDSDGTARLHTEFSELHAIAAARTTPPDARALIAAAMHAGIPWYRMDRDPFDPLEGEFRLRANGLLRFGHGRHRLTLDGVFCVERLERWHVLVRNRFRRLAWLQHSGLPVADTAERVCLTAARARRLGRTLGGPVWAASSSAAGLIEIDATDRLERLQARAEELLSDGSEIVLGRVPPGRRLDLLWIHGEFFGFMPTGQAQSRQDVSTVPPEAARVCARLAGALGTGCLSVAMIETAGGWFVLDFDLNPQLDRFVADRDALDRAAQALMRWLYPHGCDGRIPIMAVTGTNGKTTTCHMAESILLQAGCRVGVATSLGSRVSGKTISELEDGYLPGHLSVLGHPDVEVAVMEATRGGARSVGLGFDRCDFSACLNVAEDHLNDELGLRTVEELAEVKQWIALRAVKEVVLNLDDPRSRAMITSIADQRLTLVSGTRSAECLFDEFPGVDGCCTVEMHDGREWIVRTDRDGARPMVPVDGVPMALGGAARFNVSNAAHAAALCSAFGISAERIAAGLKNLRPEFQALPGRLNLYQVGDFRVLFDYAHNPHGVEALVSLIDRLPAIGRKRLNFAVSGRRSDDFAREVAALVAGHFDEYWCTNYAALHHRRPDEIPDLLKAELLANGVEPERIRTMEVGDEAIAHALRSAHKDDLLVFLVGKTLRDQWKIIENFGSVMAVESAAVGSASARDASV